MTYTTFFSLNDPHTNKVKFIRTTKIQIQLEMRNLFELAIRDNSGDDPMVVWIRSIFNLGLSPMVESLGQFKLNDHEVSKKLEELKMSAGLLNEESEEAKELAKEVVIDLFSDLDKPAVDKPAVKKPAVKKTTAKTKRVPKK